MLKWRKMDAFDRDSVMFSLHLPQHMMVPYITVISTSEDPSNWSYNLCVATVSFEDFAGYINDRTNEAVIFDITVSLPTSHLKYERTIINSLKTVLISKTSFKTAPNIIVEH